MDFFDAVESRRSVRKYLPEPVPREVIDRALSAALLAPNSSNLQPWEIFLVSSLEKKAAMVTACLDQSAAATAAGLVVFTARTDTWRRNRGHLLKALKESSGTPDMILKYYNEIVPLMYAHGWLNTLGWLKKIVFSIVGIFRPVPRGPFFKCRSKIRTFQDGSPSLPKLHASYRSPRVCHVSDGGIRCLPGKKDSWTWEKKHRCDGDRHGESQSGRNLWPTAPTRPRAFSL